MEGTTNGTGDSGHEKAPRRVEEDDPGIRTEFERMMFEFNPEENAPKQEPEAAQPAQQARPAPDEPPAYD